MKVIKVVASRVDVSLRLGECRLDGYSGFVCQQLMGKWGAYQMPYFYILIPNLS